MSFEYTVIAAPTRGEKARHAKTPGDRYALALGAELNRMARDGWDYVRAEVLPSEERSGLTGRSTVYHNLLVFRRPLAPAPADPALLPKPEYAVAASPARAPEPVPVMPQAAAPQPRVAPDAMPGNGGPSREPLPGTVTEASAEATPPAPREAPARS